MWTARSMTLAHDLERTAPWRSRSRGGPRGCSRCPGRSSTPCAGRRAGTARSRHTTRRSPPAPSASRPPAAPAGRDSARSHIMSKAYWAWPTARMAWWIRPPDSRVWAITKASPPRRACHRRASARRRSARADGPCRPRPRPCNGSGRTISMPGVSRGTRNIDIPLYRLASGSVTAMTMKNAACSAFEVKNLSPEITHSSPSRRPGTEQGRVGARLGLGHRECREELALEQRRR